jgi:DNA-binding SARP family transcriptional activator
LLAYGAGGALGAGDLAAAEAFLKESEALPGVPARFDLCLHHLFSTWLAMRRHDRVRAYQQQKLALRMAIEVGCPVFEVLCRIAAAQVLYEGGESRAAWLQFQQIYDTARRIRNHLLEYTGLLSYAYVALDSGRRPRSGMRALQQALAVGKPRNYVCFPLWRPEMLARLCGLALEAGVEQDFVRRLIDARTLELDSAISGLLQWPWPLRVYTLGRFGVMKEGGWISFSGKAQRRPLDLLKVIVACGGREVTEERVIEALWPRIDGDSAHRSFTITLHRLRKLLGIERAVQLSDGKLSLDGRLVWVDAWAFEQVTARIQRALHPELGAAPVDRASLMGLSKRLVEHYAGPFLGSEPEQAWLLPLRDRLRQRFMRAVADVARDWETAGSAALSIEIMERAIELDHASEGTYRFLMECYMRLGRRAEAVDTYSRCRRMLAAVLNVAPSRETTALFQTLTQAP